MISALQQLTGGNAAQWQRKLGAHYLPHVLIVHVPAPAGWVPAMLDKPAPPQGVNAWVCRGVECLPAITEFEHLVATLKTAGH